MKALRKTNEALQRMCEPCEQEDAPSQPRQLTIFTFYCRIKRRIVNELRFLRVWEVKHADRKKGMSHKFEEHVRCLMATGTTARQTREGLILNAALFLKDEDECAEYHSELPGVEWFSKQREALGVESYLYTFMRIAGWVRNCTTVGLR